MRVRVSKRLALVAGLSMALTTLSAAHIAATPIYASPVRDLTASDFHEIALQGFGDSQNSWAWGSAWYKNRLYIGTNRAWACIQPAALNYALPFLFPYPPPPDDDLSVQCNPDYHAIQENGEIWMLNPSGTQPLTQSNWTEMYTEPATVTVKDISTTTGLTQTYRDMAFRSMIVYTDTINGQPTQSLYVSGLNTKSINGSSVPPPSLLRSTDGGHFTPVPANPGTTMGDINTLPGIVGITGQKGGCCMRGAVAYNGAFYILIGTIQGGGAVFESPTPWLGDNTFQQVTPPGMQVFELEPFNGHLYLGLQSLGKGYTVVQTDANCPTLPCPQSAFTQIVPPGGGLGSQGDSLLTSMHVFTDTAGVPHLYVGTDGALDSRPTEIVRINTDDSWDLVVGNPRTVNGVQKNPLSGLGEGFGWPFTWHMWRMATYQNVLYVGTFDASTLWKDTSLEPVLKPFMGFDLWASDDGVHFSPVTLNGLGDMFSYGLRTLMPTANNGMFLGSANWFHGLRIWQGGVSTSAWRLAPHDVHIDRSAGRGVALTWSAPSNAVLYHIYRSTETPTYLGQPSTKLSPALVGEDFALTPHRLMSYTPGVMWLPHAYVEVGTATGAHFVDRRAFRFGHYLYYIVAQDAQGHLSAPSNATAYPNLAP